MLNVIRRIFILGITPFLLTCLTLEDASAMGGRRPKPKKTVKKTVNECSVLVQGFSKNDPVYFGKIRPEYQASYNAQLQLKEAAIDASKSILKRLDKCPANSIKVLRVHSYGAQVTHYILAQGRKNRVHSNFKKIQNQVVSVLSLTGAGRGTVLQDINCSNAFTRGIGAFFGAPCVRALSTNKSEHSAAQGKYTGVPMILAYSANSSELLGVPGLIIGKAGIGWWDYVIRRKRSQNDSVLPQFSSRFCQDTKPITSINGNCTKLDGGTYIKDLNVTNSEYSGSRVKNYGHNGFKEKENVVMVNFR